MTTHKYKDKKYIEWIKTWSCYICGVQGKHVDPSHIKTRGSGGGDLNNVLPMCRSCHYRFERLSKEQKEKYYEPARTFTNMYQMGVKADDWGDWWDYVGA